MNSHKRKRSHASHSLLEEIRKDTTREAWSILTTDLAKWLDRIDNIDSSMKTSVEDTNTESIMSSTHHIDNLAMDIKRKCGIVKAFLAMTVPEISYGENHANAVLDCLSSCIANLHSSANEEDENRMIISRRVYNAHYAAAKLRDDEKGVVEDLREVYLREALIVDARRMRTAMQYLKIQILVVMNFIEKNEQKLAGFGLRA